MDHDSTKDKKKHADVHEPKDPFTELVEKLQAESPKFKERTIQALEWFRQKTDIIEEQEKNPLEIYETSRKKAFSFPGQIIAFKYVPINKTTLPYYDLYPLTLVLDLYHDGFLGINFHYLRPVDRAFFMSMLYKYLGKTNFKHVIKIRYEQLLKKQTMKYYRPCIKRYLYSRMSDRISIIEPEMWDIALFLPSEKFLTGAGGKNTKRKVWEESRLIIKRNLGK
jgi:hypothetical protein